MHQVATEDIGGRLRRAREGRGLSLRDAAEMTKLPVDVLRAIERNDFSRLPSGMYRKAYVRTFAAEVGLDSNEIASEYSRLFDPPQEPPASASRLASAPEPLISSLAPSPRPSLLTLAAFGALVVGWLAFRPSQGAPVTPLDISTSRIVVDHVPLKAPVSVDGTREAVGSAAGASAAIAGPLRIELVATGWCWVTAAADGRRVIYRLVEPAERVMLEAERSISLRLGNAGSVTVSINGGEPRSPGRSGEVVDLEVTPDNVRHPKEVLVKAA